jgi:hypothetical protein
MVPYAAGYALALLDRQPVTGFETALTVVGDVSRPWASTNEPGAT